MNARFKPPRVTSKAILESARGESCLLQINGVCNDNNETVVACHSNWHEDGGGIGKKSQDIYISYGCSACHDWLDGRSKGSDEDKRDAFHRGMKRTWARMIEKGIITIKGYKP